MHRKRFFFLFWGEKGEGVCVWGGGVEGALRNGILTSAHRGMYEEALASCQLFITSTITFKGIIDIASSVTRNV